MGEAPPYTDKEIEDRLVGMVVAGFSRPDESSAILKLVEVVPDVLSPVEHVELEIRAEYLKGEEHDELVAYIRGLAE